MSIYYFRHTIHTTVTDFHVVSVKDFMIFMGFSEMFV